MSIADDPHRFITNDKSASIPRLSMAAAMVKKLVYPKRINVWQDARDDSQERVYRSLGDLMKEYDRRHRNDDFDAKHFSNVELMVKSALVAGSLASPATALGKIALKVGSKAGDVGTASIMAELKEHGYAQTSKWLDGQLAKWRAGATYTESEAVRLFSPAQQRKFLEDSLEVDTLLDAAVSERDKPIMREMAVRALDDRVKQGFAIDKEYDAAQDKAIKANASQIAKVSATLSEFMDATKGELANIADIQAELKEQVSALVGRVDQNSGDIEFLQQFMFQKMDPAEQAAALKAGFFAGMGDQERGRILEKIALVEKRQSLLNAVSTYAQGASTVARIADRLGVDRNVVNAIQTTAEIASVATAVATGFMTGGLGYLAAADAVTGLLFGGGSQDSDATRHEQVMQALSEISGQVEEVRQMLVEVQKGINLILKNQEQLHNDIVALAGQVAKNHKETMEVLTLIREDIDAVKEIGNNILFTDVEACAVFQERLVIDGFDDLTAIPFQALCSAFHDYGQIGLRGLMDRLSHPLETGDYHLSRHAKAGGPSDEYLSMYRALYGYLAEGFLAARFDNLLPALATPVTTLSAVAAKRRVLGKTPVDSYDLFYMTHSWAARQQALREPLSPEVLARHADFLIFCHPFFEMRAVLAEWDVEKFCLLEETSDEGRYLLQTAMDVVRTIIMQHVLISGDVLLEDLDLAWRDGFDLGKVRETESNAQAQERAAPWVRLLALLPKQTLLRRNLLLYSVDKHVRATSNLVAYSVAYAVEGDPTYLRKLLPTDRFALEWVVPPSGTRPSAEPVPGARSTGWHMRLGEELYPLPHPNHIVSGRIMMSPVLETMIELRSRLSAELAGYTIPTSLTPEKRADMRKMALDAASVSRPKRLAA